MVLAKRGPGLNADSRTRSTNARQVPAFCSYETGIYLALVSDGEQLTQSQTRWDEIRRSQQQSTPQRSAWDRVREGQAGNPASSTERGGRITGPSGADRERAAAQAEFDRMLEKERRMGSE